MVIIGAVVAGALRTAHAALGEALAIHLEALGLLACAARPPALDEGGRGGLLPLASPEFVLEGEGRLLECGLGLLLQAGVGVEGDIPVGFDEEEGVGEVGRLARPERSILQQIQLAHLLSISYINIILC